ncbi:HAMP domain-containing histidine kinase [Azospirillum griseum]|uniref:histidine kinase n=2 Tax=Azospirillum griseum TaxID=2496639 RepID=A0A431VPH8_9PROT|nr:HAMP domain-containing histidine kinase [Azospirillum griseum]
MIWMLDDRQQAELEADLRGMAQSLSASVDRELASQIRPLELLTALCQAEVDNLPALYSQATAASHSQNGWLAMGLIGAESNRFLFHTHYPLGVQPLPPPRLDHVTRKAVVTGRSVVGGVLPPGGPPGRSSLVLRSPIFADDQVRYVMSLAVGLEGLADVLKTRKLPGDWTVSVIDPAMLIAARSRDAAAYLGQRITPSLENYLTANERGLFLSKTKDGSDVYTVVHRSADTQWSVALGVPVELVTGRLAATRLAVVGGGVLACLATLSLALLVSRSFRRRRKAEQEMRRARDALLMEQRRRLVAEKEHAEASSRAKSEFLANMSHELRTPLNAILGFAEAILSGVFGAPSAKHTEYIQAIHQSGRHLLGLVNELLDMAKIEAGQLELVRSRVVLGEVLTDCLGLVEALSLRKGVSVTMAPIDPTVMVMADGVRLRQAVLNILSNAIKFTPGGGTVRMEAAAAPQGGGAIITITDSGIGMSEDEVRIALEPFRQVTNYLTKSESGTGLGLPLARRFIEAHGGALVVDSISGVGTTVRITLPDLVTP